MSTNDSTDRAAYITLGAMFGVALGAVVGILAAPKSGQDSREQIRLKALETREKAMHKADELREKTRQKVGEQREKAVEAITKVADKAETAAEKTQQTARRTRLQAEEDLDKRA